MFQESVVLIGAEERMVGIHTVPKTRLVSGSADFCLLMTNTGIGTRLGPFRFHVDLARRLSALGIASVRFDVSGLGDSPARVTDQPALQRGAADLKVAMKVLRERFGYKKFIFFGNCSASFRALLAASESDDAAGIVTYDTYCYSNKISKIKRICDILFQLQRWRFLFRRFFLKKALTQAGWNFGVVISNTKGESEWLQLSQAEEIFKTCAHKGIKQLHYYSQSLDNTLNHSEQFWRMFPSLCAYRNSQIAVKYLVGMDHLASFAEARRILLDDVCRWIELNFLTPESTN